MHVQLETFFGVTAAYYNYTLSVDTLRMNISFVISVRWGTLDGNRIFPRVISQRLSLLITLHYTTHALRDQALEMLALPALLSSWTKTRVRAMWA
jgi:hypothetical protein